MHNHLDHMNISICKTNMIKLLLLLVLPTSHATTIPISPFTLSFDSTSSTTTFSSLDLDAIASAAQKYIDGHDLLQTALGLDEEYDGVEFTASISDERGTKRNLRRLQNTKDVTLEGSASFSESDGLPSQERLSEVVVKLFRNGEQLFVKELKEEIEEVGGSDWLGEVSGYDVVMVDDYASNGAAVGDDTSLTGQTSGESASNTASGVVAQTQIANTDENTTGVNLFIVIGAAGAIFAFLLLLTGLCYAKRNHNNKKDSPISSPPSKRSILKNSTATSMASPTSVPSPIAPEEGSDDESNADFMMARAQLQNAHSSIQPRVTSGASVVSGAYSSYADDNMSYAFSVEGESIVGSRAGNTVGGDSAIGAGGISAFRNESGGVFRWNEDGTKVSFD
jgi:hypothetical protein